MWAKLGMTLYIVGASLSIILYLLGLSGGFFRFLAPDKAFYLFGAGMLLGALMLIIGLIDMAKNGSSVRTYLMLCALVPAGNFVYLLIYARNYPMLNDVSTDMVHPPVFVAAAKLPENSGVSMVFPLEFKKDIEQTYPDLVPLAITQMSADDAFIKTTEVINGLSNWEITGNQIGSREIVVEGTVTSELFGFVDDIVIRIQKPSAGAGCVVDMRSRSRMGKGDFGQNAAHIHEFMGLLQ